MPTLVDEAKRMGAAGGPLEFVGGAHRRHQSEYMVRLAEHIESRNGAMPGPRTAYGKVATGIGKTLATAAVLGLDAAMHDRRSVVSVPTRSLRRDGQQTERQVNAILHAMGYRMVKMAQRFSRSQYVGPSRIDALKTRVSRGVLALTPPYIDLLRYCDAAWAAGEWASFEGYKDQLGVLPAGLTERALCLGPADRETWIYKQIAEANAEARDADVMYVTHTMLMMNSISGGRALQTQVQNEDEGLGPSGTLVFEEAHRVPDVAWDHQTSSLSVLDVQRVVAEASARYAKAGPQTLAALAGGIVLVELGLQFFRVWRALHPSPNIAVVISKSDPPSDPATTEVLTNLELIDRGLGTIKAVAFGRYAQDDRDPMLAEAVIGEMQANLFSIRRFEKNRWPMLELLPATEPDDVVIRCNLDYGRRLVNQYWRGNESGERFHSFSAVVFVSGTLTDPPPYGHSMSWIKRATGYDESLDGPAREFPPIPASTRSPLGSIQAVGVADRELVPRPFLSKPDGSYRLNSAFVDFCTTELLAHAIRLLPDPDARTLVLPHSYTMLDALHAGCPTLRDRMVVRSRNSNLAADIERFRRTRGGIFLSCELESLDLVLEGRTLVDYLIIPTIPVPPIDPIRSSRTANFLEQYMPGAEADRRAYLRSLRAGAAAAYRSLGQAVGRGIRSPLDVVRRLDIYDARFPLPLHIANDPRVQMIRAGFGGAKLYGSFDSILDPFGVREWYKLGNGNLTKIWPPS
jgi:Rad3-related DNA helicase